MFSGIRCSDSGIASFACGEASAGQGKNMGAIRVPVAVSRDIVQASRAGKTYGERFRVRGFPLVGTYLGDVTSSARVASGIGIAGAALGVSSTNLGRRKDGEKLDIHLPSMTGVGTAAALAGAAIVLGLPLRSRVGSVAAKQLKSQEAAIDLGVQYAKNGVITGIRHTEQDGWSVVAMPQRYRGIGNSRRGTQSLDWETMVSPWLNRTYRENPANIMLGGKRAPFTAMAGPYGTFGGIVDRQVLRPQYQRYGSVGIMGDLRSSFRTPNGYTEWHVDYKTGKQGRVISPLRDAVVK